MVLVHPLSDQPAPSPITTPAATPHTPALVQRYIDYLKYIYINKSPILKEKLLLQPKKIIRLNLVSNAAQEDKEFKCDCLLLKLYGDVAAIKKKRRPMEMEDIGRSEDQSVAQHILVEGSPGIGKTMFSWELCRQWAECARCCSNAEGKGCSRMPYNKTSRTHLCARGKELVRPFPT